MLFLVTGSANACDLVPKMGMKTKGLQVQFINKSVGDIKKVEWDFGDGFASKKVDAVHRYSKAGAYNFTLTIENTDGCIKAFEGKVYVFDVKKKATKAVATKKVTKPTPPTAKTTKEVTTVERIENVTALTAYPNPFSISTTLTFELLTTGTVSIDVLDITGKTVKKVVKEVMQSGQNEVVIDRDNLANGTYLVTITTSNSVSTQKLVIQ